MFLLHRSLCLPISDIQLSWLFVDAIMSETTIYAPSDELIVLKATSSPAHKRSELQSILFSARHHRSRPGSFEFSTVQHHFSTTFLHNGLEEARCGRHHNTPLLLCPTYTVED
jgi:hypothetical protein